jgi:hypothetical protein
MFRDRLARHALGAQGYELPPPAPTQEDGVREGVGVAVDDPVVGAGGAGDALQVRDESDSSADLLDPTLLALVLALLALPIVALSLDVANYGAAAGPDFKPAQVSVLDFGRWSGALGAVVAAALIAGTIGAPMVRIHEVIGGLFTLLVAWVVAMAALPVLPVLLHLNYGGSLGFASICPITTCQAGIGTRDAVGGVQQLWLFWAAPFFAPLSFATLGLGVAWWTRMVRSWAPEKAFGG